MRPRFTLGGVGVIQVTSNMSAVAESFASLFEESLSRQEMRAGEVITAEVVRIDGESYRVKETKEREAQRKVERSAKAKSAMPRVQKGGE